MKTSALRRILEDSKTGACLVIRFAKKTSVNRMPDLVGAGAMVEHFVRTGRIDFVRTDEGNSTLVIAKTPLFLMQDAAELASRISEFVMSTESRAIPEHHMTLEQGTSGWQLKLEGGNKLLRGYFKMSCEAAQNRYQINASVLYDKGGVAVLDLSNGSDEAVLEFSERVAKMFGTQLIM